MSDLPSTFLDYINRRGYNTFDRAEESVRHRQPWSYDNYKESVSDILNGEEIELLDTTSAITGETVSTVSGGAISGSTAVASATSSITPGVALGAGLVGSSILGGVVSSLSDNIHKDPVISIPGHHYAGPGNTLTDTKPIDADDHLAQQHDKDYQNAKSDQDIREADRHFIAENIELAKQGDPHAIINTVGIGSKYALESLTGVIYKGTYSLFFYKLCPLRKLN